ncbi:SagB-type dehydrogenase family enzyme [Terracoccus luteus]|uniref:SagB-type dehydrogenase family enzyme n=1 Tax=Terracoccus luteus TaxID=53356 RepID=A0A495XZ16_9MICO|nr:SagB family peptide dehydrogenase [Terracoccus luteus]RKT79850.1 SagB-type dehydrogenase family enzyme [Terracoccus luteus]
MTVIDSIVAQGGERRPEAQSNEQTGAAGGFEDASGLGTAAAPVDAVRGLRLRDGVAALVEDGLLELRYDGSPVLRVKGLPAPVSGRFTSLGERATAEPLTAPDAAVFDRVASAVGRCLAEGVWQDDALVVQAESVRPGRVVRPTSLTADDEVRLSKFAYLHRRDERLHVESPVQGSRVVVHDTRVLDLVGRLAERTRVGELTDATGLRPTTVHAVLELLVGAGVADLADADHDGILASDTDVQRQWDFHDLLFHSRSRVGRTDEAFGGVFPYRGEIKPLAPVRPHHDGLHVDLPRPDLDEVRERDAPLVTVMEGRTSVRHYGEQPLTAAQLGEFLYRTARVRGTYGPMPESGMPYPASSRPYPCGGAGYELELYLTVARCEGVDPGCYHYEADTHRLTLLPTPPSLRQQLLDTASLSAGGDVRPDVLVTMTARFQRISWKYRSIAYAVTLKHVGVLYQTMYLVATAMHLAACGLGSGNSDLTADAFGLDYLEESGVGELILGSLPSPFAGAPVPGGNPIGKMGADPTWEPHLDPGWYASSHARLNGYGS